MEDSDVIEFWREELKFDTWYMDFLGHQDVEDHSKFDFEIPMELIPWTESIAGDAIVAKIGTFLTYQNMPNLWHAWDGRIHSPCSGDIIVQKIIKEMHIALSTALGHIQDIVDSRVNRLLDSGADEAEVKKISGIYDNKYKRHRLFRDRVASMAGIAAMVGICKRSFSRSDDYFDNDQKYLAVRNCVFDLDSVRNSSERCFPTPLKHDASMPITRYMDVDYAPELIQDDNNIWVNFLRSSLKEGDDQDAIFNHLQRVVGASFMGESKLRTIINLKGPPSSGKSIFVNAIWKIGRAGSEYCIMPDSRSITKVQGNNFEQDRFKSKRFIAISEPSHREEIDDPFLKRLTGDEWMETRTLNVKTAGWTPQGVLYVSSNQSLRIDTTDDAIITRVQVIDFPYKFVVDAQNEGEKEQDSTLSEKLESEEGRSKILNWILEGICMYYFGIDEANTPDGYRKDLGVFVDARKLKLPDSIVIKQKKLMATGSPPRRWLLDQEEEGILTVEAHRPPGSPPVQANAYLNVDEAFRMFQLWSAENAERSITPKRYFIKDMEDKFEVVRYSSQNKFKGLLKTNAYQVNPMNTVSVSQTEMLVDPVNAPEIGSPMPGFAYPPSLH